MKKKLLILLLVLHFSGKTQSQTFPNPATLSTGQGTPGSLDPLWLVSPWYSSSPPNPIGLSYSSALINNNCAPGAWVDPAALPPPVNNGNWISGSDAPCTGQVGYRYFRLTINLPPDCNGNSVTTPGNYILYFSGYVDNGISDVFINGTSTGINGGGFSTGTQLNMTLTGPWVAGINYVDVLVYNGGGPYGLLLVANSSASAAADGDGDGVSDLNDECPCQSGSLANGCAASIVGNTVICNGESTTLTSTGIGTYLWNTGSTNSSITVNPSLTTGYYVLVTVLNGDKDSSFINITVNPTPVVLITGDTLLCQGENTTLTATGGGTYIWNTGSTNAIITETPASTTNYKVVVTNSFSCKDSLSQTVTIYPKPIADFTFTNQCDGTAIPFSSTSTISSPGIIASCNWDFGDNITDTGTNTSHTYANPGSYSVTLIVNSSNSCSDTIVQMVTVFNNPIAAFTSTDICLADTMRFINTSSVNLPASIFNYLWTFGDNSLYDTLENPNHSYTNAGTYNVDLVITTTDGCSDTATIQTNVFDAPTTGFTFNNTCLSDSAIFINTTLNPIMGSIAGWVWDFGDGSALNTTNYNPTHLYTTPGNYQVTLITYSSNLACPDTMETSIEVFPMPSSNFNFTDMCLGDAVNFNNSSILSSGSITNWLWNFGDSSPTATIQNPDHTYTNPGTYSVSLIVTSNNNCKDSIIKNTVVHPLPIVQFSSNTVCDGNNVQYTNASNILTTDTIQSWTWNFGDSSPFDSNQNPSHLFPTNGSYAVKLQATSNFGCLDTITQTTIINPNPLVSFTASDTVGCEPLCIYFQDFSAIATGANVNLTWSMGDGSLVTNSQTFDHCYTNDSLFSANTFNVILTITSDSGCVSVLSKNNYITVYPTPSASFTVQPEITTIIDPIISIKDLSQGTDFWNWDWGDLTTSALASPLPHTYQDTGSYVIRLITSTAFGCIDSAYQTVIIEPDYLFYIPNAFTPDGDGINDFFSGSGTFVGKYEMAIFDRWGNSIFFTDDIKNPWDGKANHGSEIALEDVYIYSITITDFRKQKHVYKGIVTLIK